MKLRKNKKIFRNKHWRIMTAKKVTVRQKTVYRHRKDVII